MPLPSEPKMAMEQVASVIRPVSVTMLFVVYCVVALCNPYSLSQADCRATGGTNALSLVMVYSESSTDSDGARLGGSILNAVMIVLMFTVVTFFMYCLFKYRCMKFIWGYLGLSVGTLLGFFGFQLIYQVVVKYDIVLDKLTLGIFLFNWTVVGSASLRVCACACVCESDASPSPCAGALLLLTRRGGQSSQSSGRTRLSSGSSIWSSSAP